MLNWVYLESRFNFFFGKISTYLLNLPVSRAGRDIWFQIFYRRSRLKKYQQSSLSVQCTSTEYHLCMHTNYCISFIILICRLYYLCIILSKLCWVNTFCSLASASMTARRSCVCNFNSRKNYSNHIDWIRERLNSLFVGNHV